MKKHLIIILGGLVSLVCAAQRPQLPPPPENVIHTQRVMAPGIETRSYNMSPVYFVYPDTRLDEAAAEKLVRDLGMADVMQGHHWSVFVVNPVGEKYEAAKDLEAFKKLFNAQYTVTNLKVIGIGQGATFVNRILVPEAGASIAGVLSIGGKPFSGKVYPCAVPAVLSGKDAAKAAKPYQGASSLRQEPLLKTVILPDAKASLGKVFRTAWDEVFSRNYRFNNVGHTWYEGSKYGEFGEYELEPYMIPEHFGIERRIVTQEHPGDKDWLWYEYFPKGTETAPAKSVPLFVLLHGNTNDPRTQAETSGIIELAGEEKFVVVEMEWQGSDAYGTMGHDGIESVIYQLLEKYPQLDPSRIYAEGLSAGSITATALGIKKSHLFAAVGGHSGGIFAVARFCDENGLMAEAAQKRGFVEMPYCSVLGTADKVVPFIAPDNYKGNGYLKAWNAYELMNGVPVVSDLDFKVDPVFGFALSNRERIVTDKGGGIAVETGEVLKGTMPVVKIIAVVDYGHWNFKPTARMMWDYFRQFSRDPETKRLIYTPAK